MNRRHRLCFVFALAATIASQTPAVAQNAWLSLNLEFNKIGDFTSGGRWTTVAKGDTAGLAGISIYLTNATTFTAFLSPPEFDVHVQALFGAVRNIVVGDDLVPPYPLGIGLIGSDFHSTYVDPPGLSSFGSYGDLGSFTGGVAVATGTFSPGVITDWAASASGNVSDANVFTGPAPARVVNADTVVTVMTVRYFFSSVPEPAALSLAGLGAIGLMSAARRRGRRCGRTKQVRAA